MIATNISTLGAFIPLQKGYDYRAPVQPSSTQTESPAISSEPLSLSSAEPFKEVEGMENLRETLTRFFDTIFRDDGQRDKAVDNVLEKLLAARQPPLSEEEQTTAQYSLRMATMKLSYASDGQESSFTLSQSVLEIQVNQSKDIPPQVFDLDGQLIEMSAEELGEGRKIGYYARKNIMSELALADIESKKEALSEAKKVMDELKAFTAAMKDYRKTGNAEILKPFFETTV